jgi:hypothetical protein
MTTEKEVNALAPTSGSGNQVEQLLSLLRLKRSKSDGSLYAVLLPGIAPPGLHLSQHPSGQLHVRDKDRNISVNFDFAGLLRPSFAGSLESFAGRGYRLPTPGHRATGLIMPFSLIPTPDRTLKKESVDLDSLIRSQVAVELEDTADFKDAVRFLVSNGQLHPRDVLRLEVDDTNELVIFTCTGAQLFGPETPRLPKDVPFAGMLSRVAEQVQELAGVVMTIGPDDEEGLRTILPGFEGHLGDAKVAPLTGQGDEEMTEAMKNFVELFLPAASEASNKATVRFRRKSPEEPGEESVAGEGDSRNA